MEGVGVFSFANILFTISMTEIISASPPTVSRHGYIFSNISSTVSTATLLRSSSCMPHHVRISEVHNKQIIEIFF